MLRYLWRIVQRRCLQFPGGLDQVVHLPTVFLADHFVAFQRRKDVGCSKDALKRRGVSGHEGGSTVDEFAVSEAHRGVAYEPGGGHSVLVGCPFDLRPFGSREPVRARCAWIGTFFVRVRIGFDRDRTAFRHDFIPLGF